MSQARHTSLLWLRESDSEDLVRVKSDCHPLLYFQLFSPSSQRVGFHQLSLQFCHFRVDAHLGRFEVPVRPSASMWHLVAPCFQRSSHLRESLLATFDIPLIADIACGASPSSRREQF